MGKLFDLINKDTKHKNESKRMTVIIRQLIITFMGLSVFHLIIDAFFVKSFKGVILWMVMLAVDALTMYVSYQASKSVILALFTLQKVLWIMVAVLLFGWEGGFQFFLILLVIVYSQKTAFQFYKLRAFCNLSSFLQGQSRKNSP